MMERKKICLTPAASSPLVGSNVHVAGGSNAGIIVNKQQIGDDGKTLAATRIGLELWRHVLMRVTPFVIKLFS